MLSFSVSLATKCLSLNNEPCTNRPTLIDLSPVDFDYYPFMISLDKCNGSWVFKMITRLNEARTLIKHISCDCKCKFNSTACNLNQN